MQLAEFTRATRSHVLEYLAHIQRRSSMGGIRVATTGDQVSALFPSALLITETPTHYCADLLGAVEEFALKLEVLHRTSDSSREVLGSFDAPVAEGLFELAEGAGDIQIESMSLMSERTKLLYASRYPDLERAGTVAQASFAVPDDVAFSPLRFHAGFRDIWLRDVIVVNDWRGVVRARYFQAFWMVERDATIGDYRTRLLDKHPIGQDRMALLPAAASLEGRAFVTAASFATMSALNDVPETSITKFVEAHADILTKALGGVRVIAQPKFPWIEGNPDPTEKWIQPDFLLVESDGRAHICEFKLPLLGEKRLTAGRHRRRRFSYPVMDGLAQLANYREYFSHPAHQIFLDELGIFMEDPRNVLIIGSNENYIAEEVSEAMRMVAPVEIIDYDSLRVLYAAAGSVAPV